MRVLVLGGRGFIGRHVVTALMARGCDVVIGSRYPTARAASPSVREARFERLLTAEPWMPLVEGVDVVVNCVGILRERRGETYDAVHHRAPAALAAACVASGIAKLIHVSALGLDASASNGFLISKRAGEEALVRPGLHLVIVRPSLLDGADGFGARWLRRLARLPVHAVPASATGRISALDVDDLGIAIAALCTRSSSAGLREVELGGSEPRTLAEHLQALRGIHSNRPARTLRIPAAVASLVARVCDVLHFSPFSVGHLELLGRDNVPRHAMLADLLGRPPRRVGVALARVHGPRLAPRPAGSLIEAHADDGAAS